jgi:hypothetical protein
VFPFEVYTSASFITKKQSAQQTAFLFYGALPQTPILFLKEKNQKKKLFFQRCKATFSYSRSE